MKEPEVRKADVSTELELPMYDVIAAGFPITSDYPADRLDFNRDFIKPGIASDMILEVLVTQHVGVIYQRHNNI